MEHWILAEKLAHFVLYGMLLCWGVIPIAAGPALSTTASH